ncbi:hypothetical protein HU200_020476 [Digitaria exilis]|uniref:Uncharacterized protein n=1 Tax=Digitaria exilis TaxID=1010633 RepID=A0A835F1Z6_9POAL|nr:hypothetical protein HU200_020476 [Digitaria exilis]
MQIGQVAFHLRRSLAADADHRDGAAKRLPISSRHRTVSQSTATKLKPSRRQTPKFLASTSTHGHPCAARKCSRSAAMEPPAKPARLAAGAVARRVRAGPDVLVAAVVWRRLRAAVGRVRARGAEGVHQALHAVAPAVAAGHGDAADVALADALELVVARQAEHVPHVALRVTNEYKLLPGGECVVYLEDGRFEREGADAAVESAGVRHCEIWALRRNTASRHQLRDGFDFAVSSKGHLSLLNVTRHPFCRTVSVVCIRPHHAAAAAGEERFVLSIVFRALSRRRTERFVHHEQTTTLQVDYSDLSHALPDSNDCHRFILPKYVHGDNEVEVIVPIGLLG